MRSFIGVLLLGLMGETVVVAQSGASQGLIGFWGEAAQVEREWEEKFRAIPEPKNLRAYMKRLSARPHHFGSPYDKENAAWILAKFKEWGLDAHIEEFEVLFPTPKERLVEMMEPTRFRAALQEPTVPVDPTSSQHDEQMPTYNAYSVDGDVTAPLVYVNYGVPEDYEQLERMGISVKGAIVIARYGHSWRGIKPKMAAEYGALGCLIYSDPREDGYFRGDVFPKGAWRPAGGAQRGSVMDMPLHPGDPLTPGRGATKGVKRLPISEAKTLTKIPVLPLSHSDAQPLLAALEGPVAPPTWRGALPITYHVGPGPAQVRLRVKANWDFKTIYNVIFRIPGSVYPDEWIVRGNHHDAWVNGATDPVSGMVAQMEEARAFGELLKQGWKPKRTILYGAWDAEEQGLLGSTEWAEEHREELLQKAVAYINSDSNRRGYLEVQGSHTLEKFINEVARDIVDPEKNLSVWKRKQLKLIHDARTKEDREEARNRPEWRINALGSGSDYTVFIDHLGIASLNIGYSGESDSAGVYHSIYDDFYWYTHFGDRDFVYGRALAQTVGTAVMRLAGADLLPFDFTNFADTLRKYTQELQKLLQTNREKIRERNRQIQEGVFHAVTDPNETFVPPLTEEIPPNLNFAPLENALDALTLSAERYQKALSEAQKKDAARLKRASFAGLNAKLIASERKLTSKKGLPGRPWFKHMIYAPGFYTGYGVKTIPGVREAIEQSKWKEAETEIVRMGKVLHAERELIESAARELDRIVKEIR